MIRFRHLMHAYMHGFHAGIEPRKTNPSVVAPGAIGRKGNACERKQSSMRRFARLAEIHLNGRIKIASGITSGNKNHPRIPNTESHRRSE